MVDESAVDAAANGFFGAVDAVPTLLSARRGAAAQALGASRQHACRMRLHALMSMSTAAAGMSHVARLVAWPLDTGRRTLLASVRDRHTSTRTALCTIGLVRTSPSPRAHRGPHQTGSNVVVTGGNGSIYILYAYVQTGSEALPTIGKQKAAPAAQLEVLRDHANSVYDACINRVYDRLVIHTRDLARSP
jgi:hypothetical protein